MVPFPSDSWDMAFTGYELAELSAGHSPRSIATRRSSVVRLALQFPAIAPEGITRRHVQAHLTIRYRDKKPGGQRSLHSDLCSFFGWLAEDAGIPSAMAGIPRPKSPIPVTPVLSPEQIQAILGVCSGRTLICLRDKAIISLLIETGIRRSECIALDVADIDFRRCTALVRCGKGGKAREVVFGMDTALAIRKYLRARKTANSASFSGPLFLGHTGERLGYAGIGFMLARRGSEAGVPGLRPHILRHTWVHYALSGGVDSVDVQTLAGWTSAKQLERYAAVTRVARAHAAARAHPVLGIVRGR